jgi:hypothetical protein
MRGFSICTDDHPKIQRNFLMPQLYDNPDQEFLHRKAIQSLAIETGYPVAVVREVYEAEFSRLQAGARLSEYVVLLSSRRARETLRKRAKSVRAQSATA